MEILQMTLQLLLFASFLSAIGEPVRFMLRRFAGLFKNSNMLQILVLDVYLGSLLLYVLAAVPLPLFSGYVVWMVTLLMILIDFALHRRKVRSAFQRVRARRFFSLTCTSYETVLIVALLSFSYVAYMLPVSMLVFGSTRDTAVHSIFTQVIMENRQIPPDLQPYLAEWIIYPQGFSPTFAYAVHILGYSPPQAVLVVTALFNSLTILGVYFLGKMLASRNLKLILSLALVFTFVATWPKFITWGSNSFVVSFPLFFVCLGLLPSLLKEELRPRALLGIGILFGYLAVLHLQTYEMLIASLFVLWFSAALKRKISLLRTFKVFGVICGATMLFLSPFVYRALVVYSNPYHNVGIPNDVEIPVSQPELSLLISGILSLFDNVAVNELLRIASVILFLVSVITMFIVRRRRGLVQTSEIAQLGTAMLLGQLLILTLSSISPYDLPFYPQPLLLYLPFYFFAATAFFYLYSFVYSLFSEKVLSRIDSLGFNSKRILATGISITLIASLCSPFLYQSVFLDSRDLLGSYRVFGVTTLDDLRLILWMEANLSRDATVLVNTFQAGTFIPSIAHEKVVYPSFGSSYSVSYQRLTSLLENNVLNETTFSFIKHFNVTDIYAGSGVSSWARWTHRWDPFLFLGNPNFRLVKDFGSAYLFEFTFKNSSIYFDEKFEHERWNENGWQTSCEGNGLGSVTLSNETGARIQKSLKITTHAIYTASSREYSRIVSRQIFVQNDSDVLISFQFDATQGYHGKDTFAAVISNIYHNQSMVIATPNGIFENSSSVIRTEGHKGYIESLNLSAFWHDRFNSSFPASLVLDLVSYDFDGIENIAYVDNIQVVAVPRNRPME